MAETRPRPTQTAALDGPINPNDSIFSLYIVQLRLMHTAWISHFKAPGYIEDSTMDKFDRTVMAKVIDLTIRESKAREVIGLAEGVWIDLVDIFRSAYLSLEQRCYGFDHLTTDYNGPSTSLIVANSVSLLKDLQRLDDLLSMARNVLTAGEKVQNTAAQLGFDREVLSMINLCVKITARGYDGDGGPGEEQRWQDVITGFKKLLITSLQFLSNLVTMNERLKLMLWVSLFDNTGDPETDYPETSKEALLSKGLEPLETLAPAENMSPTSHSEESSDIQQNENVDAAASEAGKHTNSDLEMIKHKVFLTKALTGKEGYDPEQFKDELKELAELKLSSRRPSRHVKRDSRPTLQKETSSSSLPLSDTGKNAPEEGGNLLEVSRSNLGATEVLGSANSDLEKPFDQQYQMTETAADGIRKLQQGKQQLLKRLESAPVDRPSPGKNGESHTLAQTHRQDSFEAPYERQSRYESEEGDDDDEYEDEESSEGEEEDDEEEGEEELEDEGSEEDDEDESSEEDYDGIPGEDGRGLLTDVPLILGPNEIEVLPMIIMSGIVTPSPNAIDRKESTAAEQDHLVNMYTIRCHLLLAQENGRNLLRELLIFVAAWDLREEELYFKFMFKIVEAIMLNGLISFAYGCFKESKDIISPAQAVIMKLLTKIFHSRRGFTDAEGQRLATSKTNTSGPLGNSSLRCDIHIVHCLFSEFRQNIIPQICALIFLQGQIRHGYAQLEEFPLNLWDMERMYEGVYQYLEFFAILTDHDFWKQLMGYWEVTSELVTLLRELELAIPKGRIQKVTHSASPSRTPSTTPQQPPVQPPQPAVTVERPYDVAPSDASTPTPAEPPSEPIHDEPADFEWRNLKKLCVLVLSSLVWKNKTLQDQVRQFGGVTAVLSCCTHDEHNPYIREHAIMCLRFLLEGNKENQDVVKSLAEQSGLDAADQARATREFEQAGIDRYGGFQGPMAVPKEVLDQHGYETYVNREGQVGLRRRGEGNGSGPGTVLMGTGTA